MSTAVSLPANIKSELSTPYHLSPDQAARFRADGFIKLRDFFSPDTLAFFDEVVTTRTLEHNKYKDVPLGERDTYGKAFIQVGNVWEMDPVVKLLTCSPRAAQAAAQLMGTAGVRLWHDQALYKEAGGGFTPWHVDQYYWPMSSSQCCTMWMPFTAVPIEHGPLCFGQGSHLRHIARDIAISDDSEKLIQQAVRTHKVQEVFEPYDLGEVSFHYGWTLHRAGPNTLAEPRRVFTVIYMDRDMELIEPKYDAHKADWERWSPSTQVGEVMNDKLNPVLWES